MKPDRIVVETSGCAFPATLAMEVNRLSRYLSSHGALPLSTNICRETNGAYTLDGVITVIDVENWKGYDGGARGQNERFRMRFTNGTAANAWFALKYCSLFTRPLYTGRTGNGT